MSTSQNTWDAGGKLPDVKSHAGEAYETGGAANATPGFAEGSVKATMYKVPIVGWCSPNEESHKENIKGGTSGGGY